ncbi:MAG: Holliday junction DNA helicase RuvA [Planctomycetaceae bacterium]|jgi:Holliday junction DNA helicase RuvA|nr:Holliday junction DNA helicase RuvA [Planctomycetaceae bacterium]
MITKITGTLKALSMEHAILEIGAFEYEVLIPEFTRLHLQPETRKTVSLHTIEYIEGGQMQSRMTPRLIGFLTEAEREFFELFCSVDGVGVKKALRAMIRPVREVAAAIEEKDEKWLSSLPGIGAATAERIVAKLRRKVPKFTLMVDRNIPSAAADTQRDVVSEAYEALLALGHNESEARKLIDAAHADKKKYKDATELLYAVYQQVGRK